MYVMGLQMKFKVGMWSESRAKTRRESKPVGSGLRQRVIFCDTLCSNEMEWKMYWDGNKVRTTFLDSGICEKSEKKNVKNIPNTPDSSNVYINKNQFCNQMQQIPLHTFFRFSINQTHLLSASLQNLFFLNWFFRKYFFVRASSSRLPEREKTLRNRFLRNTVRWREQAKCLEHLFLAEKSTNFKFIRSGMFYCGHNGINRPNGAIGFP